MAKKHNNERRITMIQEAYCSFEVAKLLKEKGFNEGCSFVVNTISKGVMPVSWPTTNSDIEDEKANLITLPTHQMAMAWLREVHNIFIVISPVSNKGYGAVLCDVGDFDDFNYIGETDYFFHPEEAIEAALKFILKNLI